MFNLKYIYFKKNSGLQDHSFQLFSFSSKLTWEFQEPIYDSSEVSTSYEV